jgi:hypothetical protein
MMRIPTFSGKHGCRRWSSFYFLFLLSISSFQLPGASGQGLKQPIPVEVNWLSRTSKASRPEMCFPVTGWSNKAQDTEWWLILRVENGYGNRLAWLALRQVHQGGREGVLILVEAREPLLLQRAEDCSAIFFAVSSQRSSPPADGGSPAVEIIDVKTIDRERLNRFIQKLKAWHIPALRSGELWLDVPGLDYYFESHAGCLRLATLAPDASWGEWLVDELWKLPNSFSSSETQLKK